MSIYVGCDVKECGRSAEVYDEQPIPEGWAIMRTPMEIADPNAAIAEQALSALPELYRDAMAPALAIAHGNGKRKIMAILRVCDECISARLPVFRLPVQNPSPSPFSRY